MKNKSTKFPEVILIEPELFNDHRGFFFESYSKIKYMAFGINVEFVQDNHSGSLKAGTIRGMHFQLPPKAQNKLIRVTRGRILNVVVDIRQGSPTFKKYDTCILSADEKNQLFVPAGFANGLCTLEDNTELCYKVDNYYSTEHDRSFRWNDPEIAIDWPVDKPVLSQRDLEAVLFKDVENLFKYEK